MKDIIMYSAIIPKELEKYLVAKRQQRGDKFDFFKKIKFFARWSFF
jgi:acid phosphatase class B